jgi:hypothetical protein
MREISPNGEQPSGELHSATSDSRTVTDHAADFGESSSNWLAISRRNVQTLQNRCVYRHSIDPSMVIFTDTRQPA